MPSLHTGAMPTDTRRPALPHPARRLPVLGDVFAVNRRSPTQSELDLAKQLGPIYELKFGSDRFLVVSSGELATQVNDEDRWSKLVAGPFRAMRSKGFTGKGLLTANTSDPLWNHANELLGPAFTQAAMRSYHGEMASAVTQLLELWSGSGGKPVDVVDDMSRLTLEVIGRAGFGRSLGTLETDYDYGFTQRIRGALTAISQSSNDFPGSDALKRSRSRAFESDKEWLRRYAAQIIDTADESTKASLLGNMLAGAGARPPLPRDNIVDQAITFLAAGTDTTAGLLSFALFFLARDPQLLQATQQDVDQTIKGAGIGFDDVPRLRGVRRVLDETLRLWPVAPGYFRIAKTDQSLGAYSVSRGDVAFVLTLGVHRDQATWGPDADEFDPGRFAPGAGRHPDRVFKPFGTGPRACIGRQFALHEATLALAAIIRTFDPCFEGSAVPELHVDEMLTLKPRDLKLTMHTRS